MSPINHKNSYTHLHTTKRRKEHVRTFYFPSVSVFVDFVDFVLVSMFLYPMAVHGDEHVASPQACAISGGVCCHRRHRHPSVRLNDTKLERTHETMEKEDQESKCEGRKTKKLVFSLFHPFPLMHKSDVCITILLSCSFRRHCQNEKTSIVHLNPNMRSLR